MTKLDYELLELVKKAFVPMAGRSSAEPVAGASMMTAGLAAPIQDPSQAPMSPEMMEGEMPPEMMGMDPAMMGGMPPEMMGMDPAMMGGMPPEMMGMDPAMLEQLMAMEAGQGGGQPGTITLTIDQLIELIHAFSGSGAKGSSGEAKAKSTKEEGTSQKLDKILMLLEGALGGPQGPMM